MANVTRPLDVLKQALNNRVIVTLRGGREYRGTLEGYDLHLNLVLASAEIHNDLVYAGHHHTPTAVAAPEITDRLVVMSATTKTFNIAGGHTGNVIIPDAEMRGRFLATLAALNLSPNSFGLHMATAAYSAEGAAWVDGLMAYLGENQRLFNAGLAGIPGVAPMQMEATYLSWVDFSKTGMETAEIRKRIERDAKIAANYGETFGSGGESFMRFNLGLPRARINDAVARMQSAFGDLQ